MKLWIAETVGKEFAYAVGKNFAEFAFGVKATVDADHFFCFYNSSVLLYSSYN